MAGFVSWTEYCGVALSRHSSGAYLYATNHVALDADGSLFAFHPDNIGRDDLGFASWLRAASEALDLQCAAKPDKIRRSADKLGHFDRLGEQETFLKNYASGPQVDQKTSSFAL